MTVVDDAQAAIDRRAQGPVNDELAGIYERVKAGILWLVDHDPGGGFNFWWRADLGLHSPMSNQPPERIAAWKEYHAARTLWERLWKKMERLERQLDKEGSST